MTDWLLYRMNEAGRVISSEKLQPVSKAELRRVAAERLAGCHGIEVWDGAICILRLRNGPPDAPKS